MRLFLPKPEDRADRRLLMHDAVATALGGTRHADAVVNTLMAARMQVPPEHVARLRALIGPERAAQCTSLPKLARGSHAFEKSGLV